jgi:hypothetical protein
LRLPGNISRAITSVSVTLPQATERGRPSRASSAFRKPTSKAALWMMISAPAQVLHDLVGHRRKQRLVGQELVGDAVHLERASWLGRSGFR